MLTPETLDTIHGALLEMRDRSERLSMQWREGTEPQKQMLGLTDRIDAALAELAAHKAATVGARWEPVEHEFRLGKLVTWDDGVEDGDGITDWWIRIDDIATPLYDYRLCRLTEQPAQEGSNE